MISDNWCPECQGEGQIYTSRYGGNDPDVWPVGSCDECGGDGTRKRYTPSKRRWRAKHVPSTPAGRLAKELSVAARARLTLAGKVFPGGFWTMPEGRRYILECWKQHMEQAKQCRVERATKADR